MARTTRLSVLDVGHGNAAVINNGQNVAVIDTGKGTALQEFLSEDSITHIDHVFISHADADHIKGLRRLINSGIVTVGDVFLNPDGVQDSIAWEDLIYALTKSRSPATRLNETLNSTNPGRIVCGEAIIEVLAPSQYVALRGPGNWVRDEKTGKPGNVLTSNSISAMIRVCYLETRVALFPGDIDFVGLKQVIDDEIDISASLAIFPHHGGHPGKTAMTQEFVDKFCEYVSPNSVIFSMGRNLFLNPQPAIVERLKANLPGVSLACTQLSKNCADSTPLPQNHLTRAFAAGKREDLCCAGTLHIDLNETIGQIMPLNKHQQYVQLNIPDALCN